MRSSLRKALDDYNKYLKKMGLDKLRKRKSRGTFVFEGCENRTGIPTGDKIPVFGVLHKSNLVPVWDEQDAKEISKMRRG